MGDGRASAPTLDGAVARLRPVPDRLCLQGALFARGQRAGVEPRLRGCLSHAREMAGATTNASPVDRRKSSSKHDLICDGDDLPFKVID